MNNNYSALIRISNDGRVEKNGGGEGITSYGVENPPGMAEHVWTLPEANLYIVCLRKIKDPLRSVRAGMAVLTSLTHKCDQEYGSSVP